MTDIQSKKMNTLFFILLHTTLFVLTFLESSLVDFSLPRLLLRILLYGVTLAAGLLCVYRCIPLWKSNKPLLLGLCALAALLVCSMVFKGGSLIPFLLLSLTVLSRGVSLKKIFRATILDLCIATAVIVALCLVGILPDAVDFRRTGGFFPGDYIRHSLGFLVHNQIPVTFWACILLFLLCAPERVTVWHLVGLALINQAFFHFFGSRIIYLLGMMLLVFFAIVRTLDYRNGLRWHRLAYPLGPIAMGVTAGFSYLMVAIYDTSSPLLVRLDLILNNRFRLGQAAFGKYPVSLLGHGSEAALYPTDPFTVDNGYLLTVIHQGLPFLLVLLGCYLLLFYLCKRRDNIYLLLMLAALAVECLINAHLFTFKLLPLYCILANPSDPMLTPRAPQPLQFYLPKEPLP